MPHNDIITVTVRDDRVLIKKQKNPIKTVLFDLSLTCFCGFIGLELSAPNGEKHDLSQKMKANGLKFLQ